MAKMAAAGLFGSIPKDSGGADTWYTGSTIPQNVKPEAMVVVKVIATSF